MIKVVMKNGDNRRKLITEVVDELGDSFVDRIKKSETVLIKVNLISHEKQLASTHVDAVRGLLDVIKLHSRARVYIGDAGYSGTLASFRNFGYERLIEEYDKVELVDLNDDEWILGYSIRKDRSHNEIRLSKLAQNVDLKISLTPMKINTDIGASLSVENWTIGTWIVPPRISTVGKVWARWPWLEEEGLWAHNATIMELYKQNKCDYAIIDGVQAMEGEGPVGGRLVEMNVVLGGSDAVAVDSVACTLMGVEPYDVGYLTMCDDEKLGSVDVTHMDVPMTIHSLRRDFERPINFNNNIQTWKTK